MAGRFFTLSAVLLYVIVFLLSTVAATSADGSLEAQPQQQSSQQQVAVHEVNEKTSLSEKYDPKDQALASSTIEAKPDGYFDMVKNAVNAVSSMLPTFGAPAPPQYKHTEDNEADPHRLIRRADNNGGIVAAEAVQTSAATELLSVQDDAQKPDEKATPVFALASEASPPQAAPPEAAVPQSPSGSGESHSGSTVLSMSQVDAKATSPTTATQPESAMLRSQAT